jgi:hypothetical protein
MCNQCTEKRDERFGYDIPVDQPTNTVYYFDETTGKRSAFRNLEYALVLDPVAVNQLGITNLVKYLDKFTFNAGDVGKLDYHAFATTNNKKS